ncbi:MAG: DUF465 domain-containing protein [Pseudomonadota bacterium]
MSNTPHELADDFPELAPKLAELRQTNAHLARLAGEYHDVNGQVHRAETNVDPMDDIALIGLRKTRMALKDEIYRMLTQAA